MIAPLVFVAVLGMLVWVAIAFNRLVRLRNLVREAWGGIDVQLTRRHDLVPALVECTRGHAAFERETLDSVTRLRAAPASRARQDGENALSSQLRGLLAVAEAYPELRAADSFLALQAQLIEVENQLQMARRYYNGAVRDYDIGVESFPANLLASRVGFVRQDFFEVASATTRAVPEVQL
ncbi:MAG: LemA family protein [bacterium]